MFNLFNRAKDEQTKVKDIVWISSMAKWDGMINEQKQNSNTNFVFWFDDSLREAADHLASANFSQANLISARELHSHAAVEGPVIFAEHYPLRKKEQALFNDLGLKEVTVFSSLDEAIFKRFGSDKIIALVKQLGMKESEPINHPMISKAIGNAQLKLQDQVIAEHLASSQSDWFKRNVMA
jgi:hypothetical protein